MEGQNPYQPPGGSEYEFDEAENRVIAKTAKLARLWGVFALIVGGLLLVAIGVVIAMAQRLAYELNVDYRTITGIAAGLAPLVIVDLVVGGLYIASGSSLQAVIDTAGDDVQHLMRGVNRLGNAFRIEAIVTAVALVGGFILGFALATGEEVAPWMQ